MVELLAPAGDFDSLKAAVLNGADAVYLGGKDFSARQYAGNFDRQEMVEAIRFCHSYNVKVYITMNILLSNKELESALDYAAFLYSIGVDALIVQDLGLITLLREHLPEFELHASTQMTAHSLDNVNALYEMGIKRVVLSRELNLSEIENIAKNTKAEIEIFVHGALCFCFSGQCLFSSMIGGRSGNRGRCAQPCRQQYSIDESNSMYYLSPKDLCTLEFLNEIISTGVCSLKIEGRMKKPEYVAATVGSYKRAILNKSNPDDYKKVMQVFNRGGFTKGYLVDKQDSDFISYQKPKNFGTFLGTVSASRGKFADINLKADLNVGDGIEIFGKNTGAPVSGIKVNGASTSHVSEGETASVFLPNTAKGDLIYKTFDEKISKELEESYKGKNIKKVPIVGRFYAHQNEPSSLTLEMNNKADNQPSKITIYGEDVEKAVKTPMSSQRIYDSLNKTGDTPFYFEEIHIDIDDNIIIPVSKLNELRRKAVELLIDKLQGKREIKTASIKINNINRQNKTPKLAIKTGRADIAKAAIDAGCDIVFFGGDELRINNGNIYDLLDYAKKRCEVYPWYPEIVLENEESFKLHADKLKDDGIDCALCGNLGFYTYLKSKGFRVYLDSGLNLFNTIAINSIDNEGCILSPELNIRQIHEIINTTEKNILINIYGRQRLMVSRYCLLRNSNGKGQKQCKANCKCQNKPHILKDKLGEKFTIVTDKKCKSYVYNSKIMQLINDSKEIIKLNPDYYVMSFLDEDAKEAGELINLYRQIFINKLHDENVKESLNLLTIKIGNNITKGHYFRGIE